MLNFWKDETGAAAAEYVLILTIIGTAIALGITAFGNAISGALSKAASVISGYTY